MARPKKQINPDIVRMLAQRGCTKEEVAREVGVSADTISRRFASEFTKGRNTLKISLREQQVKMALGGNVVMLIWLGKQYLDQSEKIEEKSEQTIKSNVTYDTNGGDEKPLDAE